MPFPCCHTQDALPARAFLGYLCPTTCSWSTVSSRYSSSRRRTTFWDGRPEGPGPGGGKSYTYIFPLQHNLPCPKKECLICEDPSPSSKMIPLSLVWIWTPSQYAIGKKNDSTQSLYVVVKPFGVFSLSPFHTIRHLTRSCNSCSWIYTICLDGGCIGSFGCLKVWPRRTSVIQIRPTRTQRYGGAYP